MNTISPFPMKITNKDQTSRSLPPDNKNQFSVRAPNAKLKEDTSKTFLVKCVSSMPLAFQMSKEQLRINYLHGKSQGKLPDNRFNQPAPAMIPPPLGIPRMPPGPNLPQGSAPTQVIATGTNPFMKNIQQYQPQKQFNPLTPQTQQPNNMFTRQNNNIPITNINRNPFIPNNQFQNNQNQYQSRHMFGATTAAQTGPGLVRQTSFGAVAETQAPFTTPVTNPLAPNQPLQQQTTGIFGQKAGGFAPGQTGLQVPGQVTQTPSFGNLGQPTQAQTSPFGQPPKPQGIFGAQTGTQPQSPFPTTLPQTTATTQPSTQPQSLTSTLDANIKQLLQSKPNLWNILALDPDFKHGFNEHGRIYVKSVLQRIIDQNIISGEALNKIIIEIYKQMYGPDNFQKVLENKKNQLKSFNQSKLNKTDLMSAKQLHDNNIKSVFPEDINALGDDFYRSFKRIPAKSRDSKFLRDDNDDDKFRLQRKFYQVKRPQKPLQVKFKFIEIKKPSDTSKKPQSTYSSESLQKIAENIYEIRKEQRRQIMPTEQDLPNVDGFTIVPSFDSIKTYTKHELLSVPKVTISNEWGSVRFKTPISLLRKTLKDCIIINQKSVQIIDEEWKVRQAQITFKKFADFSVLQEEQQNELQQKITSWCEKQKFELIKVDRERGQVIIQI